MNHILTLNSLPANVKSRWHCWTEACSADVAQETTLVTLRDGSGGFHRSCLILCLPAFTHPPASLLQTLELTFGPGAAGLTAALI